MTEPIKKYYRKDIDGLRAVAVLAVVVFHLRESWLPGGFVGVDIFFVISGYLITGIIYKELSQNKFTFKEFYQRRFRRILPALSVVILVTLIAGNFILLPTDFKRMANSAIAAQLSYANIYFTYFLDTSYFADDASLEPLLHTWSLGVEEQFYIFYPILLAAGLYKLDKKLILLVLSIGFCSSVLISQYLTRDNPMASYYMIHSRAFQLLAGGICFFLPDFKLNKITKSLANCLGFIGLTIIALTTVLLHEDKSYPGFMALPVTLATMLVILSGKFSESVTHKLLGLKPLVLVGIISYSLYLWHWPILAFAKYAFGALETNHLLLCFILMLILSTLSYRFVEKPCRDYHGSFLRVFQYYFAIPTLSIGAICIAIHASSGFGVHKLNHEYMAALSSLNDNMKPASVDPFVCQKRALAEADTNSPDCIIGQKIEPNILLWGDSHAGHFVGMLGEISSEYQFGFRNLAHSSCPPVMALPENFVPARQKKNCKDSSQIAHKIIDNYEFIVLGAAWSSYQNLNPEFHNAIETTIQTLTAAGHQVIVLGEIPMAQKVDRNCLAKNLKLKTLSCGNRSASKASRSRRTNRPIKRIALRNGAKYFDLTNTLCPDDRCSNYFSETPVYYDSIHLSRDGSRLIGAAIRKNEEVKEVFSSLPITELTNMTSLPWHTDTK